MDTAKDRLADRVVQPREECCDVSVQALGRQRIGLPRDADVRARVRAPRAPRAHPAIVRVRLQEASRRRCVTGKPLLPRSRFTSRFLATDTLHQPGTREPHERGERLSALKNGATADHARTSVAAAYGDRPRRTWWSSELTGQHFDVGRTLVCGPGMQQLTPRSRTGRPGSGTRHPRLHVGLPPPLWRESHSAPRPPLPRRRSRPP